MKYLCAIYLDEKRVHAMPAADYRAVVKECLDYEESLRPTGKLLAAKALEPTLTATTVQVRNDKASMTDGPFAETKEQLAGFFMVNAADLNEALRIASNMPQARLGSIEVRPIKDLGMH